MDARLDLGSEKSGNYGHAGRIGEVGGSAPSKEGAAAGKDTDAIKHGAPAPVSHTAKAPQTVLGKTRPTPILAKDLDHAVDLILKGKVVELKDVETVHTVLEKLADIASHAEKKGEKAPHYDLCKVSVAGTNLFCGSIVKTERFPDGIPRIEMPQLTGKAREGSAADALPKSKKGNINAVDAFMSHLKDSGISVSKDKVPAASLKATQMELVGPKVAGMMTDEKFDPGDEPIFVSSDGYILDGHHRWAAAVGRDAKDGKLGQTKMKVRVVDAPISELLLRAEVFVAEFGILPKSGSSQAPKTALSMIFDDEVEWKLPFREKLLKLSERWTSDEEETSRPT